MVAKPTDPSDAQADFTISNELGLHVRAAAMVVRTAGSFQSAIWFECGGAKANARSVLDLLTLAATRGTVVTVRAEGDDAAAAVAGLGALIGRNFAE